MRMAFGLLSVLITFAIVFYLMYGALGSGGQSYVGTVLGEGRKAEQQVNEFSGKSADGRRWATDSITFVIEGSPVTRIVVTSVVAGGEMAKKYGLMKGDAITQLGPLPVKSTISDDGDAKDFLNDAYARSFPLTVVRDGKTIELPLPPGAAPQPANGAQPAAQPGSADAAQAAPAPPPYKDNRTPLARQLDAIRDAGKSSEGEK